MESSSFRDQIALTITLVKIIRNVAISLRNAFSLLKHEQNNRWHVLGWILIPERRKSEYNANSRNPGWLNWINLGVGIDSKGQKNKTFAIVFHSTVYTVLHPHALPVVRKFRGLTRTIEIDLWN